MLFKKLEIHVNFPLLLQNSRLSELASAVQILVNAGSGKIEFHNTEIKEDSYKVKSEQDSKTFTIEYTPHLIYAHLIESTGIVEIFRNLIFLMLTCEKQGAPNPCMAQWLLVTEDTFFSNIRKLPFASACSEIRPSFRGSRWNIYQRMLGNTFNHDRNFSFPAPDSANTALLSKTLELLLEVRSGLRFQAVTTMPNTTDYPKIQELRKQISEMLKARRSFLDVTRIELLSCALLSWLHFFIEWDESPVVGHFKLRNLPIEDRLASIAREVGMTCHQQSRAYFSMAETAEKLFASIESAPAALFFNSVKKYDPSSSGGISEDEMYSLISNWELICQRPPVRS